jgi:hypothetical protein
MFHKKYVLFFTLHIKSLTDPYHRTSSIVRQDAKCLPAGPHHGQPSRFPVMKRPMDSCIENLILMKTKSLPLRSKQISCRKHISAQLYASQGN